MSLRIGPNVGSLAIQTALHSSEREVFRSTRNISSGSRLAGGGDVAGLAQSENLRSDIKANEVAQRNAQQAMSFSGVAEGALAEQTNLVVRMRELAVQAASDTYSESERSFIQTEYSNLQSEVDRISATTTFGSQKLLDGSAGQIDIQVGNSSDKNSRISFDADADSSASALGLSSSGVSDQSDARDSIERTDLAMDKLSSLRAKYGSLQSRLESADNQLGSAVESLSSARSQINDADIPKEISNLRRQQVLQQYQTSLLQQTNDQMGSVLRLIG